MWPLLGKLILLAGLGLLGIVTAIKSYRTYKNTPLLTNNTPLSTNIPDSDSESVYMDPKQLLFPRKQNEYFKYPSISALQLGVIFCEKNFSMTTLTISKDVVISQFKRSPHIAELVNFLNAGFMFDQHNFRQEEKKLSVEDAQRLDELWCVVMKKIVKMLTPTWLELDYTEAIITPSMWYQIYQVLNVRVPAIVKALKTPGYASMNIGGTAYKNCWLQRLNDSLNTKPIPITLCSIRSA